MQKITIGELASKAGLNTSTIRYYEQIGLLPEADRENGQRRYDESIFDKISLINGGKQVGFSLDEIKHIVAEGKTDKKLAQVWKKVSPAKIEEINEQIKLLEAKKNILEESQNCNCESLSSCATIPR